MSEQAKTAGERIAAEFLETLRSASATGYYVQREPSEEDHATLAAMIDADRAELARSRDGWSADARRESGNAAYWRGECDQLKAQLAVMEAKDDAYARLMREHEVLKRQQPGELSQFNRQLIIESERLKAENERFERAIEGHRKSLDDRGAAFALRIQEMEREQAAWMVDGRDGSGAAHGPFASIDDAKADARRECFGNMGRINIFHVAYLDKEDWVPDSDTLMEMVLEQMNLSFDDNVFPTDAAVFVVPSAKMADAEFELYDLVAKWVEKYVETQGASWYTTGEPVDSFAVGDLGQAVTP